MNICGTDDESVLLLLLLYIFSQVLSMYSSLPKVDDSIKTFRVVF